MMKIERLKVIVIILKLREKGKTKQPVKNIEKIIMRCVKKH